MTLKALAAVAVSSLFIASCGEATKEAAAEKENTVEEVSVSEVVIYNADDQSQVNWKGEVAGVYGHTGFVNLNSGSLEIKDDKIVGGTFVVDMTNIVPTDSSSYTDEEGHRASDLAGHLSTEDFFNTGEYPTSTFVISSVEGMMVTGNLTVRGTTNEETMNVESFEMNGDDVMMTGKMVFDRQKYDVAWGFVKDMILSDDISITYSLVAKKS